MSGDQTDTPGEIPGVPQDVPQGVAQDDTQAAGGPSQPSPGGSPFQAPFPLEELPAQVPKLAAQAAAAHEAGDPAAEAQALEWLGGARFGTGDVAAGVEDLRQAVRLRRKAKDPAALGRTLMWLARLLRGAGKLSEAGHPADEALTLLTEHGDAAEAVEAAMEVASVFATRAQLPQALATLERVTDRLGPADEALALDAGHALRRVWPLFHRDLAVTSQASGAWGSAVEAWEALVQWFDAAEDPHEAMMARFAQAPLYEQLGEPKAALEVWGEVIQLSRHLGVPQVEAQCYAALATFAVKEDMRDKAIEWATYARSLALQHVEPLTYVQATSVLAECYDHQGRRTRAFELMASARELLEQSIGVEAADGLLSLLESGFRQRWGDATWERMRRERGQSPPGSGGPT